MYAAAAAIQSDGMFQVQHLMINEILNSAFWHVRAIKHTADYDRVVCRIVVSQALPRRVPAPRHQRAGKQPVKKAAIEVLKDLFQIVVTPMRRQQQFSSALLAHEMGLRRDIAPSKVLPISHGMSGFNFFAVKLRQQNVSDGMEYIPRRTRQQVGDAYQHSGVS